MSVPFDQPGNSCLPAEIDELGTVTNPGRDLLCGPGRHNPVTGDGEYVNPWPIFIHCHDIAVDQYQVGDGVPGHRIGRSDAGTWSHQTGQDAQYDENQNDIYADLHSPSQFW